MNSDMVLREQKKFIEEHPEADGWRCHVIPPPFRQNFVGRLPAFLRARLPANSWEERIHTEIGYTISLPHITRLTEKPFRRRRKKGLSEDGWQGDVRFEWLGVPIHVRRIHYQLDNTPAERMSCFNMVATKAWDALEDLFAQGQKFVSSRRNAKRFIQVINGPDIPRPKETWDGLLLPSGMKEDIRSSFEAFLKSKKRYKELGIPYKRGFLFAGPPGNGKTMATRVLASQYKVSMFTLMIRSDVTENTIEMAFTRAASLAPSVLLFEDLDKLIKGTSVNLSYLLNRLDGLQSGSGVLVIATTNEPEKLDPALVHRPSRFDRIWRFDLPREAERRALLETKGARFFSPRALDEAGLETAGFSMAYVQEAVVSALSIALTDKIEPNDAHLAASVRLLRAQMRCAATPVQPMGGATAPIGFNGHAKDGV